MIKYQGVNAKSSKTSIKKLKFQKLPSPCISKNSLKAHFAEFPLRFTHRVYFKFYLKMSFPTFIPKSSLCFVKWFYSCACHCNETNFGCCKEDSLARYQHTILGYDRHVFMKSCHPQRHLENLEQEFQFTQLQ